ncbi:MAG: metallophosphoesterase family protein [Deltaproteobacteria bacterium]|nr:metallophosphoesterase family protein [Deltaproteobacteria bacterium]
MNIKIGVLSDTHLNGVNDELKRIKTRYLGDVDYIMHAGDIVCTEVVTFLDDGNFFGVYGNMDPYGLRELLPEKRVLNFGPFRLGLIHGWGAKAGIEDRISMEFNDVDAIIYGHSHIPANHIKAGILYFNPGTAMGYSPSGLHTIGILEIDNMITGRIIEI